MNLLIIYARSETEILNRKSALGSYVFCLAEILEQDLGINVYINGEKLDTLNLNRSENQKDEINVSRSSGITAFIKRLIPKKVLQKLSEKKLFQQHEQLLQKLLNKNLVVDQVLEFYTFGSAVGLQYAQKKSIPLNVVYDSPVIEQEEFFKETKVVHKDTVIDNDQSTLKHSKSIVIYSNPVKEYLINKYNLGNSKFHIHQNVDFSRFDYLSPDKNQSNGIKICFLGSFLKWHRVDLLVNVFEKLCKQFEDIELHLIGTGMEFDKIRGQVEQSEFKSKIFLPGFLDGDELKKYKSKMHIGLMPGSNWYGAPNKIFEYGASGMAVVSCRTPTICDLFTENQVQYFDIGNKEELYHKLLLLLEDREKIKDAANNLHLFVKEKYNRKNTSRAYEVLLKSGYE